MTTHQLIRRTALWRLIIVAGAIAALAVPVAGASAATQSGFGLRVFTGDNPQFLVFHSANCVINKGKTFVAIAYDEKWRLTVQLASFTGFHRYALERGHYNGRFISVISPSGAEYASDFIPPHQIPSGGQVNFSDRGKIMGGGFYPMFNEDGSDALGVAGSLTCHYPKRKHR